MSDIAKRMGKSEKDVIFQLQSLGAEITDPNQALEPEVIQALITGKKLSTRSKSVIMREDKPQPAAKKETVVRPPRPIIKPPVRAKKEVPVEEMPATPAPPPVIIPEFIQAAEDEERAAKEAPAPVVEKPRVVEPPAEQPQPVAA
ncbi:MAG TPA: translation initiation factor IF-2 N-terminal domain-containing protein, partial [Thermoanaerobaculia bacterium]|nr:translation initiation factor IF-2 N-terminal domain-containing protein [Thermoanaerobaculia bacterium]